MRKMGATKRAEEPDRDEQAQRGINEKARTPRGGSPSESGMHGEEQRIRQPDQSQRRPSRAIKEQWAEKSCPHATNPPLNEPSPGTKPPLHPRGV